MNRREQWVSLQWTLLDKYRWKKKKNSLTSEQGLNLQTPAKQRRSPEPTLSSLTMMMMMMMNHHTRWGWRLSHPRGVCSVSDTVQMRVWSCSRCGGLCPVSYWTFDSPSVKARSIKSIFSESYFKFYTYKIKLWFISNCRGQLSFLISVHPTSAAGSGHHIFSVECSDPSTQVSSVKIRDTKDLIVWCAYTESQCKVRVDWWFLNLSLMSAHLHAHRPGSQAGLLQ